MNCSHCQETEVPAEWCPRCGVTVATYLAAPAATKLRKETAYALRTTRPDE